MFYLLLTLNVCFCRLRHFSTKLSTCNKNSIPFSESCLPPPYPQFKPITPDKNYSIGPNLSSCSQEQQYYDPPRQSVISFPNGDTKPLEYSYSPYQQHLTEQVQNVSTYAKHESFTNNSSNHQYAKLHHVSPFNYT